MVKPRAVLSGLKICEHGGERERAGCRERNTADEPGLELIDFSVNLNPYGPPGFVFAAIKEAIEEIGLYPDTECRLLREKIARKFNREMDNILVGAGVSELIQLIALAFVKQRVLIPEYTYGEYEVAARMMGAEIKHIAMPLPALRIYPELILDAMKPDDVIFLCNPNNPTGQYLVKKEIEQVLEEAERVDALVVIDEAYVDFVQNAFPTHRLVTPNLVILRSLTKSFTIPGVRIGYAISSEAIITEMEKVKVPWSVSVCAEKVGMAVIDKEGDEFLVDTMERIERSKGKIERAMGVDVQIQTDANFYILDLGDGDAREVKRVLLTENGIRVRDCTSFGLPSHIRFAVRTDEENELLINRLSEDFLRNIKNDSHRDRRGG